MKNKSSFTPDLHVIFTVKKGLIYRVTLERSDDGNFGWEVSSESSEKELYRKIDLWMEAFLQKKEAPLTLPLYLDHLPPFTLSILSELQKIPFGKTTTYQELAHVTGNPKAARAVGNACARNPMVLIIPCHRVLAKAGLGGFSADGGIAVKQQLLDFEHS